MKTGRLEAFSDGVMAIIITIMVLEMKPPHRAELSELWAIWPIFVSYLLSFIYLGIYWNNHHHMLHATRVVSGSILWANLHLLFWLSLIPFATGWMGENHFAAVPLAVYGVVLFMAAVAYYILQKAIIARNGKGSILSDAVQNDWKEKLSMALYLGAIPTAFFQTWIAAAMYVLVAILWLIPDRRIERRMASGAD